MEDAVRLMFYNLRLITNKQVTFLILATTFVIIAAVNILLSRFVIFVAFPLRFLVAAFRVVGDALSTRLIVVGHADAAAPAAADGPHCLARNMLKIKSIF
jgi:hypothetical protein